MTDQSDDPATDRDQDAGVPDSDPRQIDPAGDVADLLEDHMTDAELGDDTNADDLRAFVDAAEAGEFGPANPGLEATIRVARSILETIDDERGADDVANQDQSNEGDT